MRGRDLFLKYKKIILIISHIISFVPIRLRLLLFERSRYIYGKKGILIRYILIRTIAKSCGDNVAIFQNTYILNPQNLELGSNVSIQPMCYVECGNNAGIRIGNDVSIAHSVSILATSHRYDIANLPIKDQGLIEEKTVIEDNVWIGAKATILCGTTIHSHSIIAANSVVSHSVDKDTIVGGIPARLIKTI